MHNAQFTKAWDFTLSKKVNNSSVNNTLYQSRSKKKTYWDNEDKIVVSISIFIIYHAEKWNKKNNNFFVYFFISMLMPAK